MKDQRFTYNTGPRDLPWAILFLLHLFAIIGFCIYGYSQRSNYLNQPTTDINTDIITKCCVILLACGALAIIIGVIWILLLRTFARVIIWIAFLSTIVLCLASAIVIFIFTKSWYAALPSGFAALINIIIVLVLKRRIPFATAILTAVAKVIKVYPATILVSVVSLLFQAAWIALWVSTVVFIHLFVFRNSQSVADNLSIFFLTISLYWTSQVIGNTVHLTCAGTFASWYFLGGKNNMQRNPTFQSLKRATTTSFGSVCFGSLLIAIVQALRSSNNRRGNGFAYCILSCIEQMIRYFNRYAFTQIAIYGKTYCQAAKDTFNLLVQHGVDAIMNDTIIGKVMGIITFLSALICGCLGGISAFLDPQLNNVLFIILLSFGGFLIGVILVNQVLFVIDSGVTTIFVCFAEDPQVLCNSYPDLYQVLRETNELKVGLLS